MNKQVLGMALLGGAVYLAWKNGLLAGVMGGVTDIPANTGSIPTNTGTVPATNNVNTMVLTALKARAGADGFAKLNWDQWNFYYDQVTGTPGPAIESSPTASGRGRDYQYSAEEYLITRGLTGLRGLGMIYSAVTPSSYVNSGKGNLYNWNGKKSPEYYLFPEAETLYRPL